MSDTHGAILLVRHGKPALSRAIRLSAREYRRWWDDLYESGGLTPGEVATEEVRDFAAGACAILTTPRRRAIESAALVREGYEAEVDPDLIEAHLPTPPAPDFIKVGPKTWGFVSRFLWWYFGYGDGGETRLQAEVRADRVADKLVRLSQAGDVMVVAHGFFNIMIGRALRKQGWRQIGREHFSHWNARRFEFKR